MGISMSLTETRTRYPAYDLRRGNRPEPGEREPTDLRRIGRAPKTVPDATPQTSAPIIPPQSIAGRSLLAVIAIMSFLAALTLGAVVLVRAAAGEWQAQVSREMTIQVRPIEGRDIEAEVARAAEIARATGGVAEVRPYTREESARLLEPWLGTGLALNDLPVPRLIVVTLAPGVVLDVAGLRQRLVAQVAGASLDDHRAWVERMRAVTGAAVWLGVGVLGLMLAATILLVAFATRGAMATNRAIVEVLHFVGAKNHYIANQFQRHFLLLGLKGACIGGAAAVVVFLGCRLLDRPPAAVGEPAVEALFGSLILGSDGYAGMLGVVALVAAVAAITSRLTVHRTLNALE